MNPRRIVISTVSPPGTTPAPRKRFQMESKKSYETWLVAAADTRAFYSILEDRSGTQVEYRRGWTKMAWSDRLSEAWPGRCPGCVGEIESGVINPDGTREIRSSTTRLQLYEYHGEPCDTCRHRLRAEVLGKIKALMIGYGLTAADLEGI